MDTAQFFAAYFRHLGPEEEIHLRSFDRESGAILNEWYATPSLAAAFVSRLDPDTHDTYFGTSPRRVGQKGKAGVTSVVALWADVDFKHFATPEQASRTLDGFELAPTLVVNSGGGLQAYWLLERALEPTPENVAHVESLMERLYFRLGGLDKVQDVSRIMRVPGTKNLKPEYEKPLVTVERSQPDLRYSVSQFETVLPLLPERELPGPDVQRSTRPPTVEEVRAMLAVLPKQGWDYRDYSALLMAVHSVYPDERGVKLIQEWSPALDKQTGEDITAEKFASFRAAGITIGTLVKQALDHGWKGNRGPKLRIVRDGVPAPKVRESVLVTPEWEKLLAQYPAVEREECPHHLGLLLDYMEPLQTPFEGDWSEMMALSFVSSQFPRVRFENLNLAVWFLGLAPQGVGKSIGMDELQSLFKRISEARDLDMPLFTSGTTRGLENRLAGEDKLLLAVFDEYAGFLKSLTTDHTSGMKEAMNKLYDGRSFAHHRAEEIIEGTNPFLVSVAITTPESFREHARREDMVSGYLSRMMFCVPNIYDVLPRQTYRDEEREALATLLTDHIQQYAHIRHARFDKGYSPALNEYAQGLGLNTGRLRNLDEEVGQEVEIPWGRVIARVKKLATLLELLEEHPQVVDETLLVHERNVSLAIRLAHRGAAYHKRALSFMQQSRDDASLQKVARVLSRQKAELSVRELMQLTHLEKRQVEASIQLLLGDGLAEERAGQRNSVKYKWTGKKAA